jgi:hypothetical protein
MNSITIFSKRKLIRINLRAIMKTSKNRVNALTFKSKSYKIPYLTRRTNTLKLETS